MKKILLLLIILLATNGYSQVIINGDAPEENISLGNGDLDVRGNIKVDKIQPTIYEVGGETTIKTDIKRLFSKNDDKFIASANLIRKRLCRLVYYIKIENGGYNIARFDTKIPYDKYKVILGSCDLINSEPNKETNNNYYIQKVTNGYQAVKEAKLFEHNHSWAFSVNYTSTTANTSYWRVVLYAVNNFYVTPFNVNDISPATVSYEQPQYVESVGKVGINTDTPTETLDVVGDIRMTNVNKVADTDKIGELMPLFVDKKGVLRSGGAERIAYPVRLNIDLKGNMRDYLYDLRLGLDPDKYTPIVANYRLLCLDNNSSFSIPLFSGGNQPVLNVRINKSNKRGRKGTSDSSPEITGQKDWRLYMDYYAVNPSCPKTRWEASLLVLKNAYIKDVSIKNSETENNDFEHPVILGADSYDSNSKGYIGEIGTTPDLRPDSNP